MSEEEKRLVPLTGLEIAHLAALLQGSRDRHDPRMSHEFYEWQDRLQEHLSHWWGFAYQSEDQAADGE